jgi:hypothetical protein
MILESEKGTTGLGAGIQRVQTGNDSTIALDKLVPGVGTVQLAKGETLKGHSFDRPNSNLPTFVDYLSREIAYSVGVSPEVIWSLAGLGGTASRAALMDADVFFGGVRLLIEQQFCVRFWRYAVWHFIRSGDLPYPGDDWFRVSFVPPQKTSVDIGRDGKLRLELVRAGLLSRRQYFNELGRDSDTETEDIIRDVARRKKAIERIAKEEGVTLTESEVFPPAPGAANQYQGEKPGEESKKEEPSKEAMALWSLARAHEKQQPPSVNVNFAQGAITPAAPPNVTVTMPEIKNDIHVSPTPINVEAPVVNVDRQDIHVSPTPINVTSPVVNVAAAEQPTITVNVEPTPITVAAPNVEIENTIELSNEPQTVSVRRDSRGLIKEATIK